MAKRTTRKLSSDQGNSLESCSEEAQSPLASCCLIGKDGVKTGQGVIVHGGKWVEDVGGPSNCRFVLITSHRVIPDSEKAAEDWLKLALGDKQYKVKIASCISCCGKDGILSSRSHAGESECPYYYNFTFAFLEDSIAMMLERVHNIYFPHIRAGSSLKDVISDLKAIISGRVSVYRCIQRKNGSIQQCQLLVQHKQTTVSPENAVSPSLGNQPNFAHLASVAQEPPHPAVSMAESLPSPPPLQVHSLSLQNSNLLGRIRMYEQACFLEYNNNNSDAEGAPVYTMPQRGNSRMRKSLHSLHNCAMNSGIAAMAVSHMVNLATIKNGIVRLPDPYPYLSLLLSMKTNHCEIMSDCYKNACSQLVSFIPVSEDFDSMDVEFFSTTDLCDLTECLMYMIHTLMFTKRRQLVDSNIREILESYLDLLVHILNVLRKKNELPQEHNVAKLRSTLLYEMLKPEVLKVANEEIVKRCLEVLCLLTKLFNGEGKVRDENIRLLRFILNTHTSISDTQISICESTALDEIEFLFGHGNLWNFLKAQVKEKEQLEEDNKSLQEEIMKLEVDRDESLLENAELQRQQQLDSQNLNTMQKQAKERQEQLADQEQQLKALRDCIQKKEVELTEKEAEIEGTRKHSEEIAEQLNAREEQLHDSEQQVVDKDKQLRDVSEQLQHSHAKRDTEKKNHQFTMQKLEMECQQLKHQLKVSQENIDELRRKNEESKQTNYELQEKLQESLENSKKSEQHATELQREIQRLQVELQQCHKQHKLEVQKHQEIVSKIQTEVQHLQTTIREKSTRNNELLKQYQKKSEKAHTLHQELDSTTKLFRRRDRENRIQQYQLDTITHQRDMLQWDLKQCNKDRNALEEELQQLKQWYQSEEFERMFKSKQKDKASVTTFQSDGFEKTPVAQDLQLERDQRSLKVGALELENDTLRHNLEKANKKVEDIEKKLGESEVRALKLQAQLLQQQQQKNWIISKEALTLTDDVVGHGAYGNVKKAKFRGLTVAAKILHRAIMSDHNRQLFLREMSIAAILHHPNLVQFIGATIDDSPIIITEILPTCLTDELDKGPLENEDIRKIATDIALALNYLHSNDPPIIHRDVSSANVLLERMASGWRAKLSDFGSTIFVSWRHTIAPGNVVYAAPEAVDPSQQTVKMDTYSFGIVLIEMCNRMPPNSDEREQQIRRIHWQGMASLVHACCHTNPSDRPKMASVLGTLTLLSLP